MAITARRQHDMSAKQPRSPASRKTKRTGDAPAEGQPTSGQQKKVRQIRPKAERRRELIQATIRCIAKYGLSATTVQLVTREAGLSLGIANLHFQSKENLLRATLESVMAEYHEGQVEILEGDADASPAAQLAALVEFQFSARVTNREKMAVWFAFYGEASAMPIYQKICSRMDQMAATKLEQVLGELIREGGYRHLEPKTLATGYLALVDGLWLSLLVMPKSLTKRAAKAIAMDYLLQAFPKHRRVLSGG
ncbi:MAG: TetR family transcriptional regulator C-terminal domain-containing protein [Pseudomonadales bacterium]